MDARAEGRMNASFMAYWGSYGRAPGGLCADAPGTRLVWTGVPHPVTNLVLAEAFDAAGLAEAAARMSALVTEHRIGAIWWVAPAAMRGGAGPALEAAGCTAAGSSPAMICDLARGTAAPVPGLAIERVEGPAARRHWGEIAALGFDFDATQAAAFAEREAAVPEADLAGQHRYLGRIDGEPVAVSSLVMAADYAGIYAVATLAAARRRGLGAAMTAHAMAAGRALGARQAVLQASDMGRPIYERLGFVRAFDYALFRQEPG